MSPQEMFIAGVLAGFLVSLLGIASAFITYVVLDMRK